MIRVVDPHVHGGQLGVLVPAHKQEQEEHGHVHTHVGQDGEGIPGQGGEGGGGTLLTRETPKLIEKHYLEPAILSLIGR